MNLAAQLKAAREPQHLTIGERARRSCQLAKEFEKAGDYEAAIEMLGEFWPHSDASVSLDELEKEARAEVILRIGALTGWLGSTNQDSGGQESAKDLITQSIGAFEELGLPVRAAEARADLALCYWREGALDEARIAYTSALNSVGEVDWELRATLLIRAGIVEVDSQRLNQALAFYDKAKLLLEHSKNDALKGSFHMEFAVLLERLAVAETREDYLDQALMENTAAIFHLERARNHRYLARVENNLGLLFITIGQYEDAHQHLDRARLLSTELQDIATVAQIDDSRARALLAEGRLLEAKRYAKAAVKTLEKGDHCSLLVEALTTEGVIRARLGNHTRARMVLDRAIEVAEECGDLEGAGRAKLSMIEELADQTSAIELAATFESATDLLQKSQDPSATKRLISCARTVIDALKTGESETLPAIDPAWEDFSLRQQVWSYEKALIERALRDAGGAVTKAAHLLGFKHHQSLISLINSRHRDLLDTRSAVRKRRRHIFSKPRKLKRAVPPPPQRSTSRISILHVEDHKLILQLVKDLLSAENWQVEQCADSDTALRRLTSDEHFDVLVVDSDLSGLSGLELVQRARKMTHRRRTPMIMLSGGDYETAAWRVGVDAFLKKPEEITDLPTTINRLLRERFKES